MLRKTHMCMSITYCTYMDQWKLSYLAAFTSGLAGFDIIIDLVTLLDEITFSSCQVFFHSRASSLSGLPHSFITPHNGEWEKHCFLLNLTQVHNVGYFGSLTSSATTLHMYFTTSIPHK